MPCYVKYSRPYADGSGFTTIFRADEQFGWAAGVWFVNESFKQLDFTAISSADEQFGWTAGVWFVNESFKV